MNTRRARIDLPRATAPPAPRRRAACGLLAAALLAAGCSDGGTGSAAPIASPAASPTASPSGAPSNQPVFAAPGSPGAPQSNASFSINRSVALVGAQQVPAVSTRAAGMADVSLSNADGLLSGEVTHSVPGASSAYVGLGAPGRAGEPLVMLTAVSGTRFVLPAGTVLDADRQERFRAGDLHVVVGSAAHPQGEIRGQLSDGVVGVTVEPRLDDIQAKVFTPTCSGCHTGTGESLPAVMDLTSAEASYASLVNFASLGEPDRLRVHAGLPEESLLTRKLLGTQAVGSRMPFRGARLDTAVIDAIRSWIAAGAPR